MNPQTTPDRCRLVLIVMPGTDAGHLAAALEGGDVASVLLPQGETDEATFQRSAEKLAPLAQAAGAAAIIAGDSRVAGRVKADGVHIEAKRQELADTIERMRERMMVGAGGVKTRDDALGLGEEGPDYMFFGRFGYDTDPKPHPRNLTLGSWWAEMVEIPCIVMGGSDIASVVDVAATGAEFVALSAAIFADGIDPREAVARANELLDGHAPRFRD
ncbi:thiamine phosphate synthase [Aquamicrobium ahrensii]|uniref:Thiamine-phosphate pyrophosphorylase n=1 Tax=Aquamicrobium ahrensii TaxID=469551 RepID=A0ABV2KK99_9HYPH